MVRYGKLQEGHNSSDLSLRKQEGWGRERIWHELACGLLALAAGCPPACVFRCAGLQEIAIMCMCVYRCVHVFVCVCLCAIVSMGVCARACACVRVCECVCVSLRACVCVSVCVCACV